MDTLLGLGRYNSLVGPPRYGTVLEDRLNIFSTVIGTATTVVWTVTPLAGDTDLGIYYGKKIVAEAIPQVAGKNGPPSILGVQGGALACSMGGPREQGPIRFESKPTAASPLR